MSIKNMDLVWTSFPDGGSELLTMLAIADWSNDAGGNVFPSICTLARRIRCSESQARRVLHKLIDNGWVSVVGNVHGGAPGTTRQYRLNVTRLVETASAGATPRMGATRSTGAPDGSHPCETRGSTDATLFVKKHPSRTVNEEQKRSRGSRLPDDWAPLSKELAWATSKRPDLDVAEEVEKFRDYWLAMPGRYGLKLDWGRTWKNWIRIARFLPKLQPSAADRESLTERAARLNREADEEGRPNGHLLR